jgi:RNA polymerase sigma factor (sigma-70 family)
VSGGSRTALQEYLRGLSELPPLSHERTLALAREVRAATRCFREASSRLRWIADAVIERWQRRRDQGLVTALLREGISSDTDRGESARLDERLEQLARLLEDSAPGGPAAGLLDERASTLLDAADIDLVVLCEIFRTQRPLHMPPSERRRCIERRAAAALDRREGARDEIARHSLRLVVHGCKRYRGMGCDLEDLVQEGNLALLRAVDKFDPERGFRFATYAMWWIEQAAIRAIQHHARTVRLPAHLHDRLLRLRQLERAYAATSPHRLSQDEIARGLDLPTKDVEQLVAARRPGVSLGAPLVGREDEPLRLEDTLAAATPLAPELCDRATLRRRVRTALDRLDARDRDVLRWRFGLDGPRLKLDEVGERLGVCGERARQIERAALRRLAGCEALRALAREHDGVDPA